MPAVDESADGGRAGNDARRVELLETLRCSELGKPCEGRVSFGALVATMGSVNALGMTLMDVLILMTLLSVK
jgi:hypothetical protein